MLACMRPPGKENVERSEAGDRKHGHYKAYDKHGAVIWEDPDYIIGTTQIPSGLSIGMAYAQIFNGKEVIHAWDPENLLK